MELNLRRVCEEGDEAAIEAWDGDAWQLVAELPEDDLQTSLSLDVTSWAAGNTAFRVRLRHRTTDKTRWWSVDDVGVIAAVGGFCTTAP